MLRYNYKKNVILSTYFSHSAQGEFGHWWWFLVGFKGNAIKIRRVSVALTSGGGVLCVWGAVYFFCSGLTSVLWESFCLCVKCIFGSLLNHLYGRERRVGSCCSGIYASRSMCILASRSMRILNELCIASLHWVN